MDDARALADLNVAIADAENKGDKKWLSGILAARLAFQRADGVTIEDHASFLEKVEARGDRVTRIVEPIEFYGNRAVVKCIVTSGGKDIHNLRLFVRQGSEWKLLGWANEPGQTEKHISEPSLETVYEETCNGIRASDDISFKLIGIVPLLSGAAFVTFLLGDSITATQKPLVVSLSAFSALITLGLFRWELRNVQTCDWLRTRRAAFEQALPHPANLKLPGAPQNIGKTEAEQWIYSITILAWLSVPLVVFSYESAPVLFCTYLSAAVAIGILTLASCLADVSDPRTK